ncbi:binding-protein-dependent transport systems inner membrane component [Beutenbergia cavernae DSM 12333]|uniref:Binding-protein-dependent transport systems inner membrane component n=1 Tax=Beutenbergia cavernae (strain ATCC BAA-8 / DSM 12333 / CCUG 43141 / JCM 11478 / NBRC 16432 / NCIMB 13614 / HKI 0122) TaxID=471853 RepID=C5C6A0_BEUC1|nr:ABC transporter permease [Beutenbergia cavernae]ACQ80306.1 binding-protein-dependent transport systems inner membrane component [Beutenbergia cavernae DSM 12333]
MTDTNAPDPATARVVRARRVLGPWPAIALGVAVVAVWWAVTASGAVSAALLPSPADVLRSLGELAATGDLLPAVGVTAGEALIGAALAFVCALPLAWLIGHSRLAAAALEPYVAASQAIPAVALAPLLVLWIGYGLRPIAVLCALLVFFPIVIATLLGLRTLDRDVVAAARVDGAGRWSLVRWIEFPLALPSILAGVRNGVTLSVTGAVVGEFVIGGRTGLGLLLTTQRDRSDASGMFATLLVLCALAMSLYGLVRLLEHRLEITS